jgi:hypothetical protein
MSPRTLRRDALPWAGLVAGLLGWALPDQIASNIIQENCRLGGPLLVGGTGLLGALLALAGAWVSFGVWRGSSDDPAAIGPGTRRFIAGVATLAALIFLGAIILQTIAGFVIPTCHQ